MGKKLTILLIIASLISGILSACAKNNETEIPPELPVNNPVITTELNYIVKDIPIPANFAPWQAKFSEDIIYLFDGQTVLELDYYGVEIGRVMLSNTESFNVMDLASDGGFWGLSIIYDESNTQNLESFNIIRFSQDGTELQRIIAYGADFGENEPSIRPNQFLADKDYLYIMSYHAVYVIDHTGQLVRELNAAGENLRRKDDSLFKSLFALKDGSIAVASATSDQAGQQIMLLQILNLVQNEIEEIQLSDAYGGFNDHFATGKDQEVFLCNVNGFYDYDLENGDQNQIFDSLKYGVDINRLAEIFILTDGSITMAEKSGGIIERLALYIPDTAELREKYSSIDLQSEVVATTEPEPIEKKVVTLSTIYLDNYLSDFVFGFNRTNRYYTIEIWDYSNGGRTDIEDARTSLNIDLIVGKVADINAIPQITPSNYYINQGLYRDLNEFMDNDANFNKTDYLPGLFEAMEVGGKIYELFPMFALQGTLLGKTADIGSKTGWTLDEFAAFIASKPEAKYIIGSYSKSDFVSWMVQTQLVNPHTGASFFDREVFAKILSIAERFPTESAWADDEFLRGLKDGDPILTQKPVLNFLDNQLYYEYNYFQEEITMTSFPTSQGKGWLFQAHNYFGITTTAENPEGAWEFIKFTMDNSYDFIVNLYLPVKLSLLDEVVSENLAASSQATTKYDTDRKGTEVIKEAINTSMEAIKATNTVMRFNDVISDIILEEVDSYLSGQKSADTVVDIIENRIGIYVAEQE